MIRNKYKDVYNVGCYYWIPRLAIEPKGQNTDLFSFTDWLFWLLKLWLTASGISLSCFSMIEKNQKNQQNITHQIVFTENTFLQALFFITLYDDVTVAGIQKGFLVWNICNPFVVKITLLAALLKVFILPLESSSLCLRVLFLWCLENSPLITICWHTHCVLRWQKCLRRLFLGHPCCDAHVCACSRASFQWYPNVRATKSRMARISLGCLVLKAPTKNFHYCHLWLPVLSQLLLVNQQACKSHIRPLPVFNHVNIVTISHG